MNPPRLKQIKKNIPFNYINVFFIACLNLFLILGMIIGENQFFHSFFISLGLIMNIAILFTIIITRHYSKIKIYKEKRYIITTAIFEIIILFILPLLILPTFYLLLSQTLFVIMLQSFAIFFFWKGFKNELAKLSDLSVLFGKLFFKIISSQFSHLKFKIFKIKIYLHSNLQSFARK